MKKKLFLALAITIITTLSAMGCAGGNGSNPAGEAMVSENSISGNMVAATYGNGQTVSSEDKELQLSIIYENASLWQVSDAQIKDQELSEYGYAVTDWDGDGYLEITKSGWTGDAHGSINTIYEVQQRGRVMKAMDMSEMRNCFSEPDLLYYDNVIRYCDYFGEFYYIFEGCQLDWTQRTLRSQYQIRFRDNAVMSKIVCGYSSEGRSYIYYDSEGEEISEEEYEQYIMEYSDSMEKEAIHLEWFTEISPEAITASYETMDLAELPSGLYAYVTTNVCSDIKEEDIPEWIAICQRNPIENNYYYNAVGMLIPNVYGTILDVQEAQSGFIICYKDAEGENKEASVPLDYFPADGNVIEAYRRDDCMALLCNRGELTNQVELPVEVWSETFISDGTEYTATYSRISPMYGEDFIEGHIPHADYQFVIQNDEEIVYEVTLYQMAVEYEAVYCMEDVNGDGIKDFILITNDSFGEVWRFPYVFVWDSGEETCTLAGPIKTEEMSSYETVFDTPVPFYETIRYDRDSRIFYDWNAIDMHDHNHKDIHDMVILFGAKVVNGEWRTVYELYLGEEGEDYARETRYDDEGNVISEIICTEEEQYDLVREIYDEVDYVFYDHFFLDYERTEVVVDDQFSYHRYERSDG